MLLDKQNRILIGKEVISRCEKIEIGDEVAIFYEPKLKALIIKEKSAKAENVFFIRTNVIDKKTRFRVPKLILELFPNANYLPTEKDGDIYILIL